MSRAITDDEMRASDDAPRTTHRRLPYQPALDGIRGIAILAVMFFHAFADQPVLGPSWLPGGFLGVDVFFVLSGFLITGILISDHERDGTTVSRRFWYRRTRRLLPAMLLMLVIVCAFSVVRAGALQRGSIRAQSFATLFYVENWYAIIRRPVPAPVSHMWSLSIEEQWYLVWPFLLGGILVVARRSSRMLVGAIAILCAGSAAFMAYSSTVSDPFTTYHSTLTRAGELLLGGLLAAAIRSRHEVTSRRGRLAVELGGVAALAWILWCFTTVGDHDFAWMFRGGMYSVAAATVLVILAALQPTSPVVRRVLAWRPLVAVGLISYGLYLFHFPVDAWFTHRYTGLGPVPLTALRFALAFGIAVLSYRLLERPFRDGALQGQGHWLAIAATVATLVLVVVSTSHASVPRPPAIDVSAYAFERDRVPEGTPRLLVAGELDAFDLGARSGSLLQRGVPGTAATTTASLGCQLIGSQPAIGDDYGPPAVCTSADDVYRAVAEAFRPDVVVLMVGRAEVYDQYVDGSILRVGTPEYATALTERLEQARRILQPAGKPLVLTTIPCIAGADGDRSDAATIQRDPRRLAWLNGVWRSFAARHPDDVRLVDLAPILCPNGDARPVVDGQPIRDANDRLTPAGATMLWKYLIDEALRATDTPKGPVG